MRCLSSYCISMGGESSSYLETMPLASSQSPKPAPKCLEMGKALSWKPRHWWRMLRGLIKVMMQMSCVTAGA